MECILHSIYVNIMSKLPIYTLHETVSLLILQYKNKLFLIKLRFNFLINCSNRYNLGYSLK